MKLKIRVLFLTFCLSVGLLCSCSFLGGNQGGGGGDDNTGLPDNGIYNADSELFVIREKGFDEELFLEFLQDLEAVRSRVVSLAATDSEKHEHEIVIGDTDREISVNARQRLDRIEKNKDSDVGFLIYSDGSSVAIVYDGDPDGITAKLAIDYFIENYVKSELVLAEGVAYKTTFDLIDGYAASVDDAYKDEMWALMEQMVGAEHAKSFVSAMKSLYSIYSDKMILWLANLYEPGICVCNGLYGEDTCRQTKYCGTAGFYYSNSARDTAGYLPDVETTYQALMLLNSTGVTRVAGGWKYMLDEDMLTKMGDYIRAIQTEDGNFIHPQWEHLDLGISRRSRDLKWATELLEIMNIRPYYTTPTGIPGIGAPKAASAKPLGGSKASMVSSAVMTAGHLPELDSDVSFKAYLEGLNIRYNSYGGGNSIASILGQVTARDRELLKEGKDYQLIDILIDFLDENRNTETGTWDHTPLTDPKYSVYEGVNGLMKISAAYNTAKTPIPYASEACDSAIAAITAKETVGEVVDVYNPWHALTIIFGNLNEYGTDADREMVETIRQKLYSKGADVLGSTRDRAQLFAKDDGSFSYNKDYSAAYSQGCPAAVLYTKEGDVNGTVLGSSGLLDYLYSALGLKSCKVPLFGEKERIIFMSELRDMNPGKKPPEDLSYEVEDFEDDQVGEEPIGADISTKVVHDEASIKVVQRADGQGKALEINSKYFVNNSESVTVKCRSRSNLAKTFVFEGDFCVNSTDRYYSVQIKMGNAYMLALRWENERITLWEASSSSNSKAILTKLDQSVGLGEWFRIKMEYYAGNEETVRIKLYFDNLSDEEEMKLVAVTDNYYDEKGYKLNGSGTPASTYDGTLIYVMSDCTMNMLVDNLASYKTEEEYVPYTDVDSPLSFNADAPDREAVRYDYASGELPADFSEAKGEVKVVTDGEDKLLKIGSSSAESRVTVPINLRTKTANAAILDTKIKFSSADKGKAPLTLVAVENTGNVFGFRFKISSDGQYATMYEYAGKEGALIPDAKIPTDKISSLKIEYYHDEDTALIYVDGEFVGASGASYTGGAGRTVARFTFISAAGTSVFVDDTVCERNVLDYSKATEPIRDSVVHGFESSSDKSMLVGMATVVTEGANKYAKLDSRSKEAGLTVPVVKRANISSLLVLELDLTVTTVKNDGELYRILFKDSLGQTVYSLAVAKIAGALGIYEIGLGGIGDQPLVTLQLNTLAKLKIEYFSEEKTTYIYKDGVIVARTNIISSAENYRKSPEAAELISTEVGSVIAVDNVRAETLYETFTLKENQAENNPETGKITFDKSSSGSLPEHLLATLNSDKASLKIEETVDKNGQYTNAATFVTGEENNDSIGIYAENDLSSYSAVVFEVDFKIDSNQAGSIYQLFFAAEGIRDYIYQIVVVRDSATGTISLEDWSNSSKADAKVNVLASGIDPKVWNSLKVEYFKGDSESVRIRISLNGEAVYVSDNYFGYNKNNPNSYPAPGSNVNRVYFYSFMATSGTMYVDNLSLYGTNNTCSDEVGAKS